jgi:type IV pilus assembly protein PilE
MRYLQNKNSSGFTLIELMIVVTIIAILAAIGYPGYQNYVTKARRVDAQADLLELSQYMERFFTENGRYHQDAGGTAVSLPFNKSPSEGSSTFYNLSFVAGSPTSTTFTLQAVPVGAQLKNDTQCGALSLDHTGVKCALGGTKCSNVVADASVIETCW